MIILEPKWKSWIVETTNPLFTPEQCQQIIDCGRRQKPQVAQVYLGYLLKKCQRCMMILINLYKERI